MTLLPCTTVRAWAGLGQSHSGLGSCIFLGWRGSGVGGGQHSISESEKAVFRSMVLEKHVKSGPSPLFFSVSLSESLQGWRHSMKLLNWLKNWPSQRLQFLYTPTSLPYLTGSTFCTNYTTQNSAILRFAPEQKSDWLEWNFHWSLCPDFLNRVTC